MTNAGTREAGQVHYSQYGAAGNVPGLAISDLACFSRQINSDG